MITHHRRCAYVVCDEPAPCTCEDQRKIDELEGALDRVAQVLGQEQAGETLHQDVESALAYCDARIEALEAELALSERSEDLFARKVAELEAENKSLREALDVMTRDYLEAKSRLTAVESDGYKRGIEAAARACEVIAGEIAARAPDSPFIMAHRSDAKAIRALADAPETENKRLCEALEFYADPDTYFAIGLFPDHPCGEFIDDFSEVETDRGPEWRPGKRARTALGGGHE